MKMVTYGERGIGKTEMDASGDMGKYIQFAFSKFKPKYAGHYAELYDDTGKLVSTRGTK